MALQGDGNGIVTIPVANAAGDYRVRFSAITLTEVAGMVLGQDSSNQNFIYCAAGALIRARMNGGDSASYDGVGGQVVSFEIQKTGQYVAINIDDVLFDTPPNYGAVEFETLFAYNGGTLKGSMLLSGILEMEGFSGGDRRYNFEGSGTTLVDEISGLNGTLSGFTTGGFTTVSDGITIQSVTDHQCLQRDNNGQALFTISGGITGSGATAVEYRLDGGAWQVLDASPTSSFYSGQVLITGEQDLAVRWSNDISVTDSVVKIKAAMCILIAPAQSNAVSRIINAQVYSVSAGKPTPSMYKDGEFSALADPTGIDLDSNMGSLWPYIAKQYSDLGIPVCIGNVAKGGTTLSQWQPNGINYNKGTAFADDCGGIEFAISLIGESDSAAGTSTSVFKSEYLTIINAINLAYDCDIYAVYFPVGINTGTTQNVDNIRLAYDELIAENTIIKFGGDLSVIDISSATNALNDDLHIKLDADAVTGSNIIWNELPSIPALSSLLNITLTGIPDGGHVTYLFDQTNEASLPKQTLTYSSGEASATVNVSNGTRIWSMVDVTDTKLNSGGADVGVTT